MRLYVVRFNDLLSIILFFNAILNENWNDCEVTEITWISLVISRIMLPCVSELQYSAFFIFYPPCFAISYGMLFHALFISPFPN